MKKAGMILCVLAVVALTGPSAQAVTAKVNGTVVFQDNFEDGTVGTAPAPDDPQVGSWHDAYRSGFYNISDVDPYSGGQCLSSVPSKGVLESSDLGLAAGDVLTLEFAVKTTTEWNYLGFRNGAEWWDLLAQVIFVGDPPYSYHQTAPGWSEPGAILLVDGSGNIFPGAIWTNAVAVDEWNEILMTHVAGSQTLSISVAGGPAHDFTDLTAGDPVSMFWLRTAYITTVGSWDASGGGGALAADFNDDGVIDDLDLTILATHWQMAGDHSQGDANDDGFVDDLDLTALATEWPAGDLDVSAVPEPAMLSLLALGGAALIRRKR